VKISIGVVIFINMIIMIQVADGGAVEKKNKLLKDVKYQSILPKMRTLKWKNTIYKMYN